MKTFEALIERMSKNYKKIDEFFRAAFVAWQIIGSTLLFASLFIELYEHSSRVLPETTAESKE